MYTHICVYIYIYTHANLHLSRDLFVYPCMCMCIHIELSVNIRRRNLGSQAEERHGNGRKNQGKHASIPPKPRGEEPQKGAKRAENTTWLTNLDGKKHKPPPEKKRQSRRNKGLFKEKPSKASCIILCNSLIYSPCPFLEILRALPS